MRLMPQQQRVMETLVEAFLDDEVLYYKESTVKSLVANGFVEQNPEMVKSDGAVATRLTQAGMDLMKTEIEEGEKKVEKFEIESGVEMPKKTRNRKSKYPFDALEVMQSFHLAERPAKSMASAVSHANKRWKDERMFVVRNVGEDDPKGEGCRVFRVEMSED